MEERIFVGIDLHRNYFTFYSTNEKGDEICKERLSNSKGSIDYLLRKLKKTPEVVIEATRNWMWIVKVLRERNCKVVLAHPYKTKAIASARIKTDSVDAKTLCHLLRSNLIPNAYISSEEEQEGREIGRGRIALVRYRTMIKNKVKAILGKENLNYSGSDLFGKGGRIWLEGQILSKGKRDVIGIYLRIIDHLNILIGELDKEIKERGSRLPQLKLLTSIPGIGQATAFLLATEIGNIERFTNSKQFASYFGLVPRLNQSGNHKYYGRITKLGNPYVRWALVQASHRLARMSKNFKRYVDRIAYRNGKKKAIVALARKLATIIYWVLKENREYIEDYKGPKEGRPAILPED